MKKEIIVMSLLIVVLASGCSAPPVTELTIPGHGPEIYTFANDIREALTVKTNDPNGIKQVGNDFVVMNIVFNGANETENGYFGIVLFNLISKVNLYYSYEGKYVAFNKFYYIGDAWYNSTGGQISKPQFAAPVLWLVGPSEASGTYVNLEGNTIYLSGTSYKDLTLAGDKLALIFFGIDQI